jgi:peptidoglycan hydrolase-like protein with peptidoglycan-binding domain
VNITRVTRIVAPLAALTVFFAACSSDDSSSTKETTTTTTAESTRQPNSKLSAERVKALQTKLTSVGCFSGTVDGIVGPVTRVGIEAFQEAESVTVDSQYGPATRQKLIVVADDGVKVCAAPPTPPATNGSPCTGPAILAAVPSGSTITDFGCSGDWAWAGIDVSADHVGYEATELLKAAGGGWTVVDRAQYCVPASNIPADIYNPGCTTN